MKINVIKYRVKIPVNQGVPFEQGNFRGDCKTMREVTKIINHYSNAIIM
jgi:hypothetical protein